MVSHFCPCVYTKNNTNLMVHSVILVEVPRRKDKLCGFFTGTCLKETVYKLAKPCFSSVVSCPVSQFIFLVAKREYMVNRAQQHK